MQSWQMKLEKVGISDKKCDQILVVMNQHPRQGVDPTVGSLLCVDVV